MSLPTSGTVCRVACLLLGVTAGAAAQGTARGGGAAAPAVEAAVLRAERQYLDARVRNDTAALARVLAAEYLSISSGGGVTGREPALTPPLNVSPEGKRAAAMDVDSTQVRAYGDVAVLTGRRTVRFADGDSAPPVRFTPVFVRRQDRWQIASAQLTAVRSPAPGRR
jgi:ketosteroid isomerase-like protein